MSDFKSELSEEIREASKELSSDIASNKQAKLKFINEIKNGLGDEIKKNGGRVKIIEKTWFEKLKIKLKKIFTKF